MLPFPMNLDYNEVSKDERGGTGMPNYGKNLSEQISRLRRQKGMTQEQLASRLGVSNQAVSKWENEQSCPEVTLLPLLSDVFQIPIDELFGRRESAIRLRDGLVAEFMFNGDAQDSSGNERHGQVVGAVLCADRFGQPECAYSFDGRDDYIIVDPAPSVNQEAFSMSVWCSYDANSKQEGWNGAIVSQHGFLKNHAFQLSTLDAHITFHRFLIEPDLSVSAPLQREFWYHIVATYENQTFRLYKNGNLEREQQGTLKPDPEEPMYIGRKATEEPYFFFHGKIDDLRMYDRALCHEEIQALFLEQGWKPIKEPKLPIVKENQIPILECVDHVQMVILREHIHAAAEWYKEHLAFKTLIEHKDSFYMLSLYKGASLLLHSTSAESVHMEITPFVFKTKRTIKDVTDQVVAAGASLLEVRDEGFACFLTFLDPFGHKWIVMRERR